MFVTGLIVGIVIGANLGLIIVALAFAGRGN